MAISVMGREEVLEARIASGLQMVSSVLKMLFFKSMISGAASMTRSASLASLLSVVVLIRARIAAFSASVIVPFLTPRSRLLLMVSIPFLTNSSLISDMITS